MRDFCSCLLVDCSRGKGYEHGTQGTLWGLTGLCFVFLVKVEKSGFFWLP